MIVMKFGGSSLESTEALQRVLGIIGEAQEERVVVVSAMGKTTNRLLESARLAAEGRQSEALEALVRLQEETLAIVQPLLADTIFETGTTAQLSLLFQELIKTVWALAETGLTAQASDEVASFGERISSYLVSAVLNASGLPSEHIDAPTVIRTDDRFGQAAPDYLETNRLLEERWSARKQGLCVMGGFIGSTADGRTTTLGRGGSDFTAAIVGAALRASEIQIWTDVDGMLTADPRVYSHGVPIRRLSFSEAAELAYFGAKVLHPATVLPAQRAGIPVRILNSRKPHVEGTLLVGDQVSSSNPIKAISSKRGITVVNIQSTRMLMAYGFLARIFEVFARHETPVDMVATTEVSVSLTIEDTARLAAIQHDLREFAEVDHEGGQAIVCIVGEDLRYRPGIVGRAFDALSGINIRMISQGASLLNCSFVVAEKDVEEAVRLLHETFFAALDPEVFAC